MPRKIVDFGSLNTGDVFWRRPYRRDPYIKYMVIFHPDAEFTYRAVQIVGRNKGHLALFMSSDQVEVAA